MVCSLAWVEVKSFVRIIRSPKGAKVLLAPQKHFRCQFHRREFSGLRWRWRALHLSPARAYMQGGAWLEQARACRPLEVYNMPDYWQRTR